MYGDMIVLLNVIHLFLQCVIREQIMKKKKDRKKKQKVRVLLIMCSRQLVLSLISFDVCSMNILFYFIFMLKIL